MFHKIIQESGFAVNEHHLKRYLKFVNAKFDLSGYNEKHHILPRSMFPNLKRMTFNIIPLPARVHYIAHKMLVKVFPGNSSMMTAWWFMSNSPRPEHTYRVSSRDYLRSRKLAVEANSGDNNFWNQLTPEERELRLQNHNMKNMTPEQKQSWLDNVRASQGTDESKKRKSEAQKNSLNVMPSEVREIWLTNKRLALQALPIWEHGAMTELSMKVWADASKIYDMLPAKTTIVKLCEDLGYSTQRKEWRAVKKIVKHIESGWNPNQDEKWLEWFSQIH